MLYVMNTSFLSSRKYKYKSVFPPNFTYLLDLAKNEIHKRILFLHSSNKDAEDVGGNSFFLSSCVQNEPELDTKFSYSI